MPINLINNNFILQLLRFINLIINKYFLIIALII